MWDEMRKWLQSGGTIPESPTLRTDLTAPELVPRADGKKQLESKEDMKKRSLQSPNHADALALTFAADVTADANIINKNLGIGGKVEVDFDPYGAE